MWGRNRRFQRFDELESSDLLGPFAAIPNAKASRFRCWHPVEDGRSPFEDGFIRFNVTGRYGEHRQSYRTAWFIGDPTMEPSAPSLARIARVIGSEHLEAFRLGGATTVNRIQQLLLDRFDRPMHSFKSVLDWGCGAGRLTRYLPRFSSVVTAVDIDEDNIRGCVETIRSVDFRRIGLYPPTPFPDGTFDLVLGISVLTHLREPVQNAWLCELQRIVSPGGLVLLSIQGMAQAALYLTPSDLRRTVNRDGIADFGTNPQLDEVIDEAGYYVDVVQSHDYVRSKWAEHFDVLDIVEAIAGNQDLVVMRRR